jgi:CBS domain-containing protein
MLCNEIMKRDPKCVTPEDTVLDAAKRMRLEHVGFLPVTGDGGKVIGTLTDRDIVMRVVADGLPAVTLVKDVMTNDIVSCLPTDNIRRAEALMSLHQKSRILCINEEGELEGVISLSDIAQNDARGSTRTLREVSEREAHH